MPLDRNHSKLAGALQPSRLARRPPGANFVPVSDAELDDLTDEELVAYIAAARSLGRVADAARGLAVLSWGWQPYIEFRLARKLPDHAVEYVADAVLDAASTAALEGRLVFNGSTILEFKAWLNRIISRRIADYYRHPARRFMSVRLAEDADDHEPGVQLVARDETDAVPDRLLVEEALRTLPTDRRAAAYLSELDRLPAADVAARIDGMSPANVWKNAERFRTTLRGML